MGNFDRILAEIRMCKTVSDDTKLPTLFSQLDSVALDEDAIPERSFGEIVELQRQAEFRQLENSWMILHFLNNNWDQLAPEQREQLRGVISDGFDKYRNWMGAFVTSELLGERYADENALKALTELGQNARLPARAAIPHGFEVLAKATQDAGIRERAIAELKQLRQSQFEDVRKEALISLNKLGQDDTSRS